MASSTSPFTYGAVEVIFGSIYFYFHLQTAPDLQDCPHSTNLPTIPESTLVYIYCLFFFSDQLCTIDSKIDENVETCSGMDIGGPLYIKEEGVDMSQVTPRERDRCRAFIVEYFEQ